MNHNKRMIAYFAALLGLILGFSFAFAQDDPRLWDENGVAVRQGVYPEWQRKAAKHTDGSTCMIWSDTRNGNRDIYAQRVLPDGSVAWPDNGVAVVSQSDRQEDPVIVAVEDGWIIAWAEYVDLENYNPGYDCSVHAQKLGLQGEIRWQIDGALVASIGTDFLNMKSIRIVPDSDGGAIILWIQQYIQLYAQRINSNGSVVWDEPALIANHVQENWYRGNHDAVSDGNGNMIAVWQDFRNNYSDIYAAKLLADASLPWGEGLNGVPICTAERSQERPRLCYDQAAGGAYVVWEDQRDLGEGNLYSQLVDTEGNPLWETNGILLCGAPSYQHRVRIAPSFIDGSQDGAFFVWEDTRVNGFINEVYAQKISPDGSALWGVDGLHVCGDATPDQYGNTRDEPLILSDYSGGAVIYWNDTRDVNGDVLRYDIYAARLDASGENLWGECGVSVASAEGLQEAGYMILDREESLLEVFYGNEADGSKRVDHTRLSLTDGSLIPEEETPLTDGFAGQSSDIKTIAIENDRVAIVWEDYRGQIFGKGIYYQIVDLEGHFELPMHGAMVAPDNTGGSYYYSQQSPCLTSDGNSGFFVAFADFRTGIIRARLSKINAAGEVISDPAGVMVYDELYDQQGIVLCPDGSGGCYVAWNGYNNVFTLDVFIQHFDGDCEALWSEPVRLTNDESVDDILHALIPSEDGCILVWETGDYQNTDIQSARILANGDIDWMQTVCDYDRRQTRPSASEDGNGGIFIVWEDSRSNSWPDIYTQHLNIEGESLWQTNGMPVVVTQYDQNRPATIYSPQYGLYIVWEDFRSGESVDLYAQRIDLNGNKLWEEQGLAISTADGDQSKSVLSLNNLGGLTCVWQDERGFYADIYAVDLLPDGSPTNLWWESGIGGKISTSYQRQSQPSITSLNGYQLFVAWEDWRATGFSFDDRFEDQIDYARDVFVQMIETGTTSVSKDALGLTPNEYALHQNYPNPFNPSTTISFAIPKAGQTSLVVYDLLGRTVETLMNKPLSAGSYHVSWNAAALPSGVYFYRLTSGEFSDVKKTVLLK